MTCAHKVNSKSLYSIFLAGVFALTAGITSSLTLTTEAEAKQIKCKKGYVWRQATPEDFICVRPASRKAAKQDNAAAVSRIKPGGGQYGPMTCKKGWVWRIAMGHKDRVCVSKKRRKASRVENQLHMKRAQISANAGKVPNTSTDKTLRCKPGFVWRESRHDDFICVKPAKRDLVRRENVVATARYEPGGGQYGAFTCIPGLVWREATGNDDRVCVPGARRTESKKENQLHSQRVVQTIIVDPVPEDTTLDPEYEGPYPEDEVAPEASPESSGSSGETCLKIGELEICRKD